MIRRPAGKSYTAMSANVDTTPGNGGQANIQFPVAVVTKRRQRRGEVTNAIRDERIGTLISITKNVSIV